MDGSIPEHTTDERDTCEACATPLGAPGDTAEHCSWCAASIAEMDSGVPHPATAHGPALLAHLAMVEAWAMGGRESARRTLHYEAPAGRDGVQRHTISAWIRGREIDEPGGRSVRGSGASYAEALARLIPQLSRVEKTTNEILHPREANGVDDHG